ncbi:MAG TPA: rhodanese-like domain-containing protein [Spirochaetia bacterium]|nr:rhodanese-like domain-containing protein [Spirochaetia bacterium]
MLKRYFAVLILLGIFSFLSFGQGGVDYKDPDTLKQLIEKKDKDYFLIDVRTDREYGTGFIPSAINIPYDVIGNNLPTEDRSALIVVYCASGSRSGRAKQALDELGFKNVINFGRVGRWKWELKKP